MLRSWVILILVLPLGLACSSVPEAVRQKTVTLQSPLLDRTYSPGQGPKTRHEIQLSDEFPVGGWLLNVSFEAAPNESVESAELSYVYPERHYRVLGLEGGAAAIWRFPSSPNFGDGGIPIRSNEPLWVEILWRKTDPYSPSHSARAELTITWTSQEPEPMWRTVEDESGDLKLEVENAFKGFPERLY